MRTLPDSADLPSGLTAERTDNIPRRLVMTPALAAAAEQVLRQWRVRDRFEPLLRHGIRPLDRLLFHGPPGNGKTTCAQYLAARLECDCFRVRCEQLRGQYLGETTKQVSAVMEWIDARTRPAVVLFDEVESIFIDRSTAGNQGCDNEISSSLTVFFQYFDRLASPTLICLATNMHHRLDPALLSRVELSVEFGPPTAEQAVEFVRYWSELLAEHGGEEWGPRLIAADIPMESFRALKQHVAAAAREWVMEHGTDT